MVAVQFVSLNSTVWIDRADLLGHNGTRRLRATGRVWWLPDSECPETA